MPKRKATSMPTLYNCRHSGDQYRISKFDSHFDLESSYLCTAEECECPAGHRPTCRHRAMLPAFIAREAVGTEWFFDYDRGGWVQGAALIADMAEPIASEASSADTELEPSTSAAGALYKTLSEPALPTTPALPKGVSVLPLDDPALLHNTLADALGEPTIQPAPAPTIRRRV